MARKQVIRNLPPLQNWFSDFPGFAPQENRQAAVVTKLRQAAEQLRGEDSRSFYSMREVSSFFRLPLRTVAIAYEQLEREGILNRIRGSRTLLEGRTIAPRNPVRAVVGIPIWLHAIVVSPYSRAFNLEIEEQLRAYGFVADIIFFRDREVSTTEFATRLLYHKLDYVVWHTPHPLATQTLLSLKDNGIKQILVQPSDNPTSIDLPLYLQDWNQAYTEMARCWIQAGIRHVIVPEPAYMPSRRAQRAFVATLTAHGLTAKIVQADARALQEEVRQLPPRRSAVAFLDQLGAESICNEEPGRIEELLQVTRVAFCRGPIRMPYFHRREALVDIVGFAPAEVARRIASDLRAGIVPTGNAQSTFVASYHPLVSCHGASDLL